MHGDTNVKKKYIYIQKFLPKILPFKGKFGKIWYSQTGHKYQYNTAKKRWDLDVR